MTTAAKREWLKSVALFSSLSDEELTALAASAGAMAAPKHARVFEEGSAGDCCYVLTAGEARVVLSVGGDSEVLVATVRPRMLVGELALLDGSPRSAALVAAQLCRFIRIPAAAFERLRKNAAFEQRLVKHVASTLRDSNDRIRGVSNASSLARVAWCLSRVARQEGTLDRGGILIPKRAHQELAEMAGCSRETVTRALSALKRRSACRGPVLRCGSKLRRCSVTSARSCTSQGPDDDGPAANGDRAWTGNRRHRCCALARYPPSRPLKIRWASAGCSRQGDPWLLPQAWWSSASTNLLRYDWTCRRGCAIGRARSMPA